MSSVWIQTTEKKGPSKLKGHMNHGTANVVFEQYIIHWLKQGSQYDAKRLYATEALLTRKGKVVGLLYVEHHSVPSAPEMGQPTVKTIQPKAMQ